jgi:hypothetical protein
MGPIEIMSILSLANILHSKWQGAMRAQTGPRTSVRKWEASMGDKGGKKDRQKAEKQKARKKKEREQKKRDKQPASAFKRTFGR